MTKSKIFSACYQLKNLWLQYISKFILLGLILIPGISTAEQSGYFSIIESKVINEFWLNPGFYSQHFQKDKGHNNRNIGVGTEYRYSTVSSVTLGLFDNSDRQISHYVGWYWQPVGMGSIRLGAVVGAIDGYPEMLDGGWFAAVIPAASIELHNIGANLLFIPSYKDRLYGAISFQFKLRLH